MQNQQVNNLDKQDMYASFGIRFTAFILDLLIVAIPLVIVRIPFWLLVYLYPDNILTKQILFRYNICDLLSYGLVVLYFSLFTYFSGQTFGKMVCNIKVISTNRKPLGFWNMVYRETIGRFLSSLLFIGYFIILFDPLKQGIHDMLSDTKVIYKKKKC